MREKIVLFAAKLLGVKIIVITDSLGDSDLASARYLPNEENYFPVDSAAYIPNSDL